MTLLHFPTYHHDETDAMFNTSDRAMAERFGERAKWLMLSGRDCRGVGRLAASYADRVLHSEARPDAIDQRIADLGLSLTASGAVQ